MEVTGFDGAWYARLTAGNNRESRHVLPEERYPFIPLRNKQCKTEIQMFRIVDCAPHWVPVELWYPYYGCNNRGLFPSILPGLCMQTYNSIARSPSSTRSRAIRRPIRIRSLIKSVSEQVET